jgi:polyisoprenyl-phosphate glycosyltransferase
MPLMHSLNTTVFQANKNYTGEIVFVDDGSGDDSFAELRQTQREFPALVTIIKLTRNFGQGGALMAAYNHARGSCIVTMSADGQEPPGLVNDMLQAFFEESYEVVICARAGRDESGVHEMALERDNPILESLVIMITVIGPFPMVRLGIRP